MARGFVWKTLTEAEKLSFLAMSLFFLLLIAVRGQGELNKDEWSPIEEDTDEPTPEGTSIEFFY